MATPEKTSFRRHWPILVATVATGVIAYQVAKVNRWLPWGEQNIKDPTIGPVWTGSGNKGPKIAKGWIGWAIQDTNDKSGVRVVQVYEGGPAWEEGIRADDIITSVAGEGKNATQEYLLKLVQEHGPGYSIDLEVLHPDLVSELKTVTLGVKQGIDVLCAKTIATASSGLAMLQFPDGLWPHYLGNPENKNEVRSSIGTTALACAALALAGDSASEQGKAALEKGMPALLKMIGKDGGLDDPRDGMPHRVYANSFLLLALVAMKDKHPQELDSVRSWLARNQIGGEGWDKIDPLDFRYGGWSYHGVTGSQTASKTLRADVSVTSWALDALAAAGLPADRVEWGRASRYLERTQNHGLHGREAGDRQRESEYRDGGFAFHPRYSKAGRVTVGVELEVYRSYGSATADGLRGLVAVSGDDASDAEGNREAAIQWLGRNYTLARNPGFGEADMSGWSSGVYFYWLASLARALHAAKIDSIDRGVSDVHAWPDELARLLVNFQSGKDSFYKKHLFWSPNDQMHEDSPTTSTAFAIIALCAARDRVRAGNGRVLAVKPRAAPPADRDPFSRTDLALVEKGRLLFQSVGCIGCHVDNDPTNGPSLVGVGDRYLEAMRTEAAARDFLKRHIRDSDDAKGLQREKWAAMDKTMPKFVKPASDDPKANGLPDAQLDAIVEFLLSREGNKPVSQAR